AKERRIEARRGGRPRGAARARGRLEDAGGLFVQVGRVGGGDRGRLEGTGDLVVIHVLRGGGGSGGRGRGEGGRLEGTGDLVVAEGVLVCRRCLGRRRRALDLRGQEGRQGDASRFLVLIEAGAEIAARYGQPRPLQRVDDLRDVVGGQPTVHALAPEQRAGLDALLAIQRHEGRRVDLGLRARRLREGPPGRRRWLSRRVRRRGGRSGGSGWRRRGLRRCEVSPVDRDELPAPLAFDARATASDLFVRDGVAAGAGGASDVHRTSKEGRAR